MLVALIDSQVVGAIAPQIAAGLGSAKTSAAGSVMIYAAAAAAAALLLGRYARRIKAVKWLPVAAGIFVGANALAALSPHVTVFWTARALAGLAGGLVSALVITALADASSYAQRGRQMSGVAVAYFLAPVLGVPLGVWAAGSFGWRTVFAASAALVAVAGLLVRQFPLLTVSAPEVNDETGGASEMKTEATNKRATERVSLWHLAMRSRSTRRGIVSAFFVSGGLVGLTTYLGTWLSDAFGAGARDIGFIYALAGTGAVVGGALADRYGKRRVAMASSALMSVLLLIVPTFVWSATLFALIGATAFFAALRVAPLQALITELVASSERAAYVALRNGASQLGIAAAVAAGARLYPPYGLAGVGAMCAALTLGATLSMRKLADPHDRNTPAQGDSEPASPTAEGRQQMRSFRGRRIGRKLIAGALALVLLAAVGLPWLLSFGITKAVTRPGEHDRTDTPAAGGATFEQIAFASADGNTLSGWYLPARGEQRVTIILTHGLFRSRYEMLERGLDLWRAGYAVLLYDLRRHGQSKAEFSSIGFYERRDVEAAFRFVRGRAPEHRIVLMGVSMGAAATLLAASEIQDEKLLAVVAESSFLSFEDTVRHHVALMRLPAFPFAALLIKFTAWRLNFAADDYDLLPAVRKIARPILFIGGGKDVRMPNATVLEPLYRAAQDARKGKFIVAGATHGHAYGESPEAYVKAVTDFLAAVESSPRR